MPNFVDGKLCCVSCARLQLFDPVAEDFTDVPHLMSLSVDEGAIFTRVRGTGPVSSCGTCEANGRFEIACHGVDVDGGEEQPRFCCLSKYRVRHLRDKDDESCYSVGSIVITNISETFDQNSNTVISRIYEFYSEDWFSFCPGEVDLSLSGSCGRAPTWYTEYQLNNPI